MSSELESTTAQVEDTANVTSVEAITAEPDTSSESAPATGIGSEQPQGSLAASQPADSSTPKQPANQPTPTSAPQPAAPPEPDWKDRYRHLQSETDRRLNQSQREAQQHSQELNDLRSFRQQQQDRAQQLNLKPWSKQHPEYSKFQNVLNRAKTVDQQLQAIPGNLPPEQQEAVKNAILSAVSPEDRQQLQQYRDEVQNFQRGFFEDPVGTLGPMLVPLIQEQMQQAQARTQANSQVERDFESPELKPLVQSHAAEIQTALNAGVPYDYAIHMVKMFGELQQMKSQFQTLNKDAVMGKEQTRLAKGNATITRDPAPTQISDPYALAKKDAMKQGITTDDPRFMKFLSKYDKPSSTPIFKE